MFQDHRQELCRLRRQLNVLNGTELNYLGQLLMDHHELPLAMTVTAGVTATMTDYCGKSSGHSSGPFVAVSGDMHALFKLVSSVSDQMQSQHASDYRFFMEVLPTEIAFEFLLRVM